MSKPLVLVKDLTYRYVDGTEVHIGGIPLEIHPGERVVLLGPNGSGKTSLIKMLLGLMKPSSGTLEVFGNKPSKDFSAIQKRLGVVLQNVEEQLIGPRVVDDIAFTPRNYGYDIKQIEREVDTLMKELTIEPLANRLVHYLSGGEKKKVAIAGALIAKPDLLILDEPFAGLDPQSQEELVGLLTEISVKKDIALLVTTHDLELVPALADTVYILSEGKMLMKGTPAEVFQRPDVLDSARLHVPAIYSLYIELQQRGYPIEIPARVDQAAIEKLLNLLTQKPIINYKSINGRVPKLNV